jgi:Glycosyl transferase family 2
VIAPLVSVCIPSRDCAPFLGEAIESALAQEVDGLEVLVHDDASEDGTDGVLRGFRGDRRVRCLRHPRRVGVADNRNSCLRAARGRYIAWLDADDTYLPGALERQLAMLEAHPGASVAHGAAEIVDEAGAPLPPWRRPFTRDTVEPSPRAFGELILGNELTTSTVVARRAVHVRAGPFVAVGPSSSDWDMWLRLALRGDVTYTAAPVARYRQRPGSISSGSMASGARLRSDVRVVRRVLHAERTRVPDRVATTRRADAALTAKALLQAGDLQTRGERADALRALGLAGRLRPGATSDVLPRLMLATARGDAYSCHRLTKTLLERLAGRLGGSRFGARLTRLAATDPEWNAALARIARTVRAVVPAEAQVGTVTKWDPTLLHLSGRRGRQFPDRRQLPDGYPADSAMAVAHLERLRAEGLSHLVFPSASFWWLDHYRGLADRLEQPAHADDDCLIYDLRAL